MGLTFTEYQTGVHGNQRFWQGECQFDSDYPTGGEAIAASDFGMMDIHFVVPVITIGSINRESHWDRDNSTILLKTSSTGVQLTNGSNASAVKVHLLVYGV